MNARLRPVIVGTAGHIDHGKTSLVRALTGIDADRLPEERARGMTIDIGFAHAEIDGRRVSFIDVPGHEKFIRNMAAGASGVDLAILVIAADDGVMPQTREHTEIVDLLGVSGAAIALNKTDLADASRIAAARAQIAAAVRGTCFESCPIVEVSAASGAGMEELRRTLALRIREAALPEWPSVFRLAIDRRFTIEGRGTVATGSLLGGDVAPGDEAELMPQGRRVRIRETESHGAEHRGLASGRRVAVNLPGVKKGEIERGNELAAPGYLRASGRLGARVRCLGSSPLEIESRQTFRLHIGAQDANARVALFGARVLAPGEDGWAILETEPAILAAHGQRFILRAGSHGVTIGGGQIFSTQPPATRRMREVPEWLARLAGAGSRERILAALEIEPALAAAARGLFRETGVEPAAAEPILSALADEGAIRRAPGGKGAGFWTHAHAEEMKRAVLARMEKRLAGERPRCAVDHGPLMKALADLGPAATIQGLLDELAAEGTLSEADGRWRLAGFEAQLTDEETKDLARLLAAYRAGGFAPPTLAEAEKAAAVPHARAEAIHAHALDAGKLIGITGEYALAADTHADLLARLRAGFKGGKGATVSEIKEWLGASRKYAIPICEYLDRRGYTRRAGDVRYAGARLGD